jgi:hypothetical protein
MFFHIENTMKKCTDRMKSLYYYSNIFISRMKAELSRSFSDTTCQLTFQLIVSYTTASDSDPNQPAIAVSDFNGDGHLDIVFTNCESDNVGILLGIGNGTFREQMTFSIGAYCPSAVAVGDFNSDGYVDLATVPWFNNVVILLGNGDGTLGTPMILSDEVFSLPVAIVISDFNGDSYLDFAVANNLFNGISVLPGNNDGTFGTPTTFCINICYGLSSLATGDFNNDGQLELAASGNYENIVYVLLNNGNGYFGIMTSYSTGSFSSPQSIAVGDFNNDNQLDLAITNSGKNNVGIILGNGNGDFGTQMTFSTGVFSYPYSIVIGYFNGDDQLDLAVINQEMGNVGILVGIGNGTFLPQITFSTGSDSIPAMIVSGDFDRDGKLDFAITDLSPNNVDIFRNTCDCCIPELTTESPPTH